MTGGLLSVTTVDTDGHDLLIGAEDDGPGGVRMFTEGSIDDVRVYSRALTTDELTMLATP